MTMYMRDARDYLSQNTNGCWKNRTGLEQKLIIVVSMLLVTSIALSIAVIVLDHKLPKSSSPIITTISPTESYTTNETGGSNGTDIIPGNSTSNNVTDTVSTNVTDLLSTLEQENVTSSIISILDNNTTLKVTS